MRILLLQYWLLTAKELLPHALQDSSMSFALRLQLVSGLFCWGKVLRFLLSGGTCPQACNRIYVSGK